MSVDEAIELLQRNKIGVELRSLEDAVICSAIFAPITTFDIVEYFTKSHARALVWSPSTNRMAFSQSIVNLGTFADRIITVDEIVISPTVLHPFCISSLDGLL